MDRHSSFSNPLRAPNDRVEAVPDHQSLEGIAKPETTVLLRIQGGGSIDTALCVDILARTRSGEASASELQALPVTMSRATKVKFACTTSGERPAVPSETPAGSYGQGSFCESSAKIRPVSTNKWKVQGSNQVNITCWFSAGIETWNDHETFPMWFPFPGFIPTLLFTSRKMSKPTGQATASCFSAGIAREVHPSQTKKTLAGYRLP